MGLASCASAGVHEIAAVVKVSMRAGAAGSKVADPPWVDRIVHVEDADLVPVEVGGYAADSLGTKQAGEIAFSDPALFAVTGDSLPVSLAEATERMLPTTTLRAPDRLGVYFEIYGLPADTSTPLTLTIVALDQPARLVDLGGDVGDLGRRVGRPAVRPRHSPHHARATRAISGGAGG